MSERPLHFRPAMELAALVRERKVSSTELVDLHLARIAEHNPKLQALCTLDAERARTRAREADAALARGESWGPLHGVPFTAKDLLETEGLRTTGNFKPYRDHVPTQDATAVARLRAAGAVLLGKSNCSMMGGDVQTLGPLFPRGNNPWSLEHTPGGSTGGGAAAVAAGLSPLELGSDLGGSVRIPAHYCGIYALKPTEHRVSLAGHLQTMPGTPGYIRHSLCIGPLARSVADLRLALGLMAGPDGRQLEVPPLALTEAPPREPGSLRLAWTDRVGPLPLSADTARATAALAQRLAEAGAQVERVEPEGFDWQQAWDHWSDLGWAEGIAMSPGIYGWLLRLLRLSPDPIQRRMGRSAVGSLGRQLRALAVRDRLSLALESFLARYDAWLMPAAPAPAFRHQRSFFPIPIDGGKGSYLLTSGGATCAFNFTGQPAVVLPAGRSSEGLPIGVQLVGRRWGEMELLAVAEAVDAVAGAYAPPPGYGAI